MDFVKLAFKGFFRNKRLILYIISISITFGIVISVIYSMYLLNNVLNEKINNNIVNRVIAIGREETISNKDLEDIMACENVIFSYNRLTNIQAKMNEDENVLLSYVYKEEIPEISKGAIIQNVGELQVVLPSKMYDNQRNQIDLEGYIGKNVVISYDSLKVEARVIGLYIPKYGERTVYINESFRKKLIEYNKRILNNDIVYAVVDEYKNVDNVINIVEEKYNCRAYISNTTGQRDIKLYNITKLITITILLLTICFIYISISIMLGNIISDEKMDIAILKALGYRIKDIYIIMKYRMLSIIGISFVISCFISIVLNRMIAYIIDYKLDIKLQSSISLFIITLLFFIMCVYIITLISVRLNNRKLKKINTIELLKEN